MEMIEVGLIGYGLAGRAFHAPVIRAVPRMHLAAIFERTGNEAAEKYPDVRTVRSLDELLGIREIRLVVIATPNDTHYSLARSEEHTSELQSPCNLVCRLLLEKKKTNNIFITLILM